MPVSKITDFPLAGSATLLDIFVAVQTGANVQLTAQQIVDLAQSEFVLTYPGNPNGNLAGKAYQFCVDTTNNVLYICTTTGSASTAVWTKVITAVANPVDGGTGVSNPASGTLPVAQGASPFNFVGPLVDGEVLVGATGSDPVPATITAGTNVTVVNGPGTITISSFPPGSLGWTEVTGTTQQMAAENGYIANNAGLVTLTLPVTAAVGTLISVIGKGAGGWSIAQNGGQQIHVGSLSSTVGVGGSVASSNQFDSVDLICITADTVWAVRGGPQGALTIV